MAALTGQHARSAYAQPSAARPEDNYACRRPEDTALFQCACLARRMSDTAFHLEQEVLPEVPVRHWACSFPWGVRAVLGYDKQLGRVAARSWFLE